MEALLKRQFQEDGFLILSSVFSREEVHQILNQLPKSQKPGQRNFLSDSPELANLLNHPGLQPCLNIFLGPNPRIVRSIYFNKDKDSNWTLPWHQDQFISVKEKVPLPGFSAWSRRKGYLQVRPPENVLRNIFTFRIHLDDCSENNGALEVLKGSHHHLLKAPPPNLQSMIPAMKAGDVLLMSPLLWHRSSRQKIPAPRRILHFECSSISLQQPMTWSQQFSPS